MTSQVNHMHGIGRFFQKRRDNGTLVRIRVFQRSCHLAPLILGIGLFLAISYFDCCVVGPEISVSLLYVLAVLAVTWVGSWCHGLLLAVLAAIESILSHVLLHPDSAVITLPTIWNSLTRLLVLAMVALLLGSLRQSLHEQRRLAAVDPLTRALNRRAFQIAAERERLRAARSGSPLSIAYFDLDDFKGFNDRHGHRTGDRILQSFARAVRSSIRATDLFCRIGGDEFVVFFPDTDAAAAAAVVSRVRQAAAHGCAEIDERVTLSAGIATYHYPPTTVDVMVETADQLMYRAKNSGRDRVAGAVVAGPWVRWASDSIKPDVRSIEAASSIR
jgi:diguanylate cyclase (GGDEF)-like protein